MLGAARLYFERGVTDIWPICTISLFAFNPCTMGEIAPYWKALALRLSSRCILSELFFTIVDRES
jgi:hypothetical protein